MAKDESISISKKMLRGGRVAYLDIAKGITLILMVLGHNEFPGSTAIINKVIFLFHMPLFFIVCGYLTLPKAKFDTEKKFSKLIKPYIIVFGLTIVPYYFFYGDFDVFLAFILMKTRFLFGYEGHFGIGPIWFLPCYFFANYIISRAKERFTLNEIAGGALIVFTISLFASKYLGGLPFLFYQTSIGILFIIWGYQCKERNIVKSKLFLGLGFLSSLVCLKWGYFSMYSCECKLWIFQIIAGLFCTLMLFELSKKIKTNKLLQFASIHSLTILCVHSFDWSLGISSRIVALLSIPSYLTFIFYFLFVSVGLFVVWVYKRAKVILLRND